MPHPVGSDRLEVLGGGRLCLLSRHPKAWRPRVEKGRLTPEHPGTAVRWEEQIFEVLDVDAVEGGGVRYVLALWDEQHAIRVVDNYDEATEAIRQREREARARRERHRGGLMLLSPLLGCLPGDVQQDIENEYAVPATRLTLLSLGPLFVFGTYSLIALGVLVFFQPVSSVQGPSGRLPPKLLPLPLLLAGLYFWIESLARLAISMGQGRPVGSLLGWLPWELVQILRGKRGLAGPLLPREAPSPERAAQDSYHLLEPSLSFLEARDQAKLHELYGFNGVRWGRITAIVLLVAVGPLFLATLGGIALAPEPGDILFLAATGTLVIEQVFRLRKLGRGEVAPSVLRFLVRPLARRLLGPSRP